MFAVEGAVATVSRTLVSGRTVCETVLHKDF